MTRKSKQPKSRKLGNKSDDKKFRAYDETAKRIVELFVEIINNRSKKREA
ncbi:MAG TPA: hypothetical protein VMW38_25125 [Terriglobia bacterium]|nr:hypothetical protein [Terriglobia bacterium]